MNRIVRFIRDSVEDFKQHTAVKTRVSDGIKRLNSHGPVNWRLRVQGPAFSQHDMMMSSECVLGRIYGSYCLGYTSLDIPAHKTMDYGFERVSTGENWSEYKRLAREWNRRLGL